MMLRLLDSRRLPLACASQLPYVPTVPESLIRSFTFYRHQQLQRGMFYANELYQLIAEFTTSQRLEAYQQGMGLMEQGGMVVITASPLKYCCWMSLRSSTSVPIC